MKAVRIAAYGGIDRLKVEDVEAPVAEPGEVSIEVRAAGVNYADVLQREGVYLRGPVPPFTPGIEAAGVVVARGRGVDRPSLGEPVMALTDGGLQAELAAVPAERCVSLPRELDFVRGAAFLVSYLTAYHAIAQLGRARAGETLVVHAAGGGLGTAAVQIGKALGLTVVALASTEEKRERVRALGADVACDYAALERASEAPVDLVLATVGGRATTQSVKRLAPFGRLLLAGAAGEPPVIDVTRVLHDSKQILGVHLEGLLAAEPLVRDAMSRLSAWLSEGKLRVQVGHEMPLDEVRAAHELLESRRSYGKIVLAPGGGR